MPTIQVKDAGGTTIYLNVASGAGTSGDPYVLQDSIPTGTNSIGTMGINTGTNSIGTLGANSGVDIGDVDITSIAAGDNNIGNVDIASALPAGSNAIGKLAANSGVDIGDVDVTSIAAGQTIGLEAGSAAIGKLSANSGVDIGDVDVTSLPALAAGSNAIGKLSANSGVDIGDVDILSIAAGDNNIGNVDVVTLPALVAGSAAIGKLAANSGVDIGDVTLTAGAASIGTLGANSGVDIGDVDVTSLPALAAGSAAIGATKDNGPETAGTFTYTTSSDITTAADIGPAPSGGQKSVLLQALISTDTAMQFTIQMETTAGAERQSWYLPASGSVIFVPRHPVKVGTADKKWQGIASVAGNVAVSTVTTSEA